MVEIMKKKFDQDLFLNLWCDPLGYFAKMNSTLGSVVPLAMFHIQRERKPCVILHTVYNFTHFVILRTVCSFTHGLWFNTKYSFTKNVKFYRLIVVLQSNTVFFAYKFYHEVTHFCVNNFQASRCADAKTWQIWGAHINI